MIIDSTGDINMSVVSMAYAFAAGAHCAIDQRRKYTGEQYIEHPCRVATIVAESVNVTTEMLAAAYLHDTVEDTEVELTDIRSMFGYTIADYVEYLTETSKADNPDMNRMARKTLDAARLAKAPGDVQTVKYADFIDNTSTILEYDPEFGKTYLKEKSMMLQIMDGGDPKLREKAIKITKDG